MTTRWRSSPARRNTTPVACPTLSASSGVITPLARPRIPSVPKYLRDINPHRLQDRLRSYSDPSVGCLEKCAVTLLFRLRNFPLCSREMLCAINALGGGPAAPPQTAMELAFSACGGRSVQRAVG